MALNAYSWYGQVNIGTEASPNWYHLSQGILKNFNAGVNSTSKSGSGSFRIADKTDTLWNILDALSNKGVNQEFRLYFGDKNYSDFVFGGYINNIQRPRAELVFNVDHYMQLLTREISDGDKFQDQTGSYMAADVTGTNGLIPLYFPISATGVVPISVANHVDATANQTGEEFDFSADNMSILSAMRQIAEKTRKTSGVIPYDFYVNYCPTHAKKELWFNVKNDASFASGVTLYSGSDFHDNYKLDFDLSNMVNYWTVKGEQKRPCPIDRDFWTEYDSGDDPETVGPWQDTNCDISSAGLSHVQSRTNKITPDGADAYCNIHLLLDNALAFDSTLTPSDMLGDEVGFLFDYDKPTYLTCYWRGDSDFRIDFNSGYCVCVIYAIDQTGNFFTAGLLDPLSGARLYKDGWTEMTMQLSGGIDNATTTITDLYLQIECYPSYSTQSDWAIYIDGLHFWTTDIVSSNPYSDAASIAAYGRRKGILNDRTITPRLIEKSPPDPQTYMVDGNTKEMCNRIANRLVEATATPTSTFTAHMKNYKPIYPAYTFTLNIPERGINAAPFRCTQVNYTPAGQTIYAKPSSLYDDSNYDLGYIVSQVKQTMNESSRR